MRQLASNSKYKNFKPRLNTSFEMLHQQHKTLTTTMAGISSLAAATTSQNQHSQELVYLDRENLVFSPTSQSQEFKAGQRYSSIGFFPINQVLQSQNPKVSAGYSQLQQNTSPNNLLVLQQSNPNTFFIKKQPIWQINQNLIQKNYPIHLNLQFFKTNQCNINYQHNHKHCPFYHSSKDQRRSISKFKYQHELCKHSEQQFAEEFTSTLSSQMQSKYQYINTSPFISSNNLITSQIQPQHSHLTCSFSHNRVQRLYHPDKYKTKFCTYYPNQLYKCEYQDFCCFAHSQADIKVPLLHNMIKDTDFYLFYFKTAWCPFTHQHNKAQCVYAHNWQDFRRKPNLFLYSNTMCTNWKSGTFIMTYQEGCAGQWRCGYCHGWKQKQFHPMNYKTHPCPYKKQGKNCSQKGMYNSYDECPYYHQNLGDHRQISMQQIQPKIRQDMLWDKDRILWTNNINDMRERLQKENQHSQSTTEKTFLSEASTNEKVSTYNNRRSLLNDNLSQLQQTVKQRIKFQRRFSLDFARIKNNSTGKYSDYFKLFKGDKNLLYFNLGDQQKKTQDQQEKSQLEQDKQVILDFEDQMSNSQVDNQFEEQLQIQTQKQQLTPQKAVVGCFTGFSPLISGVKPYRKLSFDIFGLDNFQLSPGCSQQDKYQKKKSLAELQDSDVQDLLNQSNLAGMELQSSSQSQQQTQPLSPPQLQEEFKQELQQKIQNISLK